MMVAPAPVEEVAPARPGWRTVNKRLERKPKAAQPSRPAASPVPAAASASGPAPPLNTRPDLPAWAQWKRKYFFRELGGIKLNAFLSQSFAISNSCCFFSYADFTTSTLWIVW